MVALTAASLVAARVRSRANRPARGSGCAARRNARGAHSVASARPAERSRGASKLARQTLDPAAAAQLAVASNLALAGAARADEGGGAVGLLALLVPVAGFLAFQAGKGGKNGDDDQDPPPPSGSQDSKNYQKNLTIAGGQNRKRRNPPKPKNL
jgi:hypothetical protein